MATWEAIEHETWGYLIWSKLYDCEDMNANPCNVGCKEYYPTTQPSYVGEITEAECGCGCGTCAYLRVTEYPYWQQVAGCADYQNCNCFDPGDPWTAQEGHLYGGDCVPN